MKTNIFHKKILDVYFVTAKFIFNIINKCSVNRIVHFLRLFINKRILLHKAKFKGGGYQLRKQVKSFSKRIYGSFPSAYNESYAAAVYPLQKNYNILNH